MSSIGALLVEFLADTSGFHKGVEGVKEGFEALKETGEKLHLEEAWEKVKDLALEASAAFAQGAQQMRSVAAVTAGMGASESFHNLAEGLSAVTTQSVPALMGVTALLGQFNLTDRQIAEMLPKLADFAAGTGRDVTASAGQMAQAIASGQASVRRLGLDLGDAGRAAFKAADETGRYNMLVEAMAKYHGQAAQQAQTAAGAQEQLKNATEGLYVSIGSVIDAPLAEFFQSKKEAVKNLSEAVLENGDKLKAFASEILGFYKQTVTGMKDTFTGILDFVDLFFARMFSTIGGLSTAFSNFWSEIKAGNVGAAFSESFGKGVKEAQETLEQLRKNSIFNSSAAGAGAGKAIDFSGTEGKLAPKASDFSNKAKGTGGPIDFSTMSIMSEKGAGETASSMSAGLAQQKTNDIAATLSEFGGTMGGFKSAVQQQIDATREAAASLMRTGPDFKKAGDDAGALVVQVARNLMGEDFANAVSDVGTKIFEGDFSTAWEAVKQAGIEATANISGILTSLQANFSVVGSQLAGAGEQMLSKMGPAGAAFGAAASKLESGDVAGAVIGLGVSVLSQTAGFQKMTASLTKVFASLVGALSPLMDALAPVFDLVVQMALVMSGFKTIIPPLVTVISAVINGIMGAVNAILGVWNSLISGLADVLDQIPLVGDTLRDAVNSLQINTTSVSVKGPLDSVASSAAGAAKSLQAVSASAQNVPQGFKVALDKFKSIDPNAKSGPAAVASTAAAAVATRVLASDTNRLRAGGTGVPGGPGTPFAGGSLSSLTAWAQQNAKPPAAPGSSIWSTIGTTVAAAAKSAPSNSTTNVTGTVINVASPNADPAKVASAVAAVISRLAYVNSGTKQTTQNIRNQYGA